MGIPKIFIQRIEEKNEQDLKTFSGVTLALTLGCRNILCIISSAFFIFLEMVLVTVEI